MAQLDAATQDAVAHAGQLLIRAAAVLGALTPAQFECLMAATDGGLIAPLVLALNTAAAHSPEVADSLKRHGPAGFPLYQMD